MMAWWWLSDVAKYLERGSLFEAAERIALVRQEALKLYAAARDVPYPLFGITSLLDYEPFEVPQNLAEAGASLIAGWRALGSPGQRRSSTARGQRDHLAPCACGPTYREHGACSSGRAIRRSRVRGLGSDAARGHG
jgi:hypothetical protein